MLVMRKLFLVLSTMVGEKVGVYDPWDVKEAQSRSGFSYPMFHCRPTNWELSLKNCIPECEISIPYRNGK